MTRARPSLWRDRGGTAGIEAGITLSALLIPMLAGLVGVGQAMLLQYRVDRATHMGLLYAWGTPTGAATTGNVVAAAQAGYGTGIGSGSGNTAAVTAALACYCVDQTGTRTSSTTTAVSCTGTCSSPTQVLGKWITVATSTTFTPVLIGSWGGATWTMRNSSTVRIQ